MGIHHHDWPLAATVASAHASALAELRALRQSIADRIEADIALLDALDGDPDLEADYASVEADASGRLYFLGRSTDDELEADQEVENEHADRSDMEDWRQPLVNFGSGCAEN